MTISTFSTLAGARRKRREIGGSIIRVLADPDDIYVVVPSLLRTRIMSVADDGSCDGAISLEELTMKGK